jgi:hypothetical protein
MLSGPNDATGRTKRQVKSVVFKLPGSPAAITWTSNSAE